MAQRIRGDQVQILVTSGGVLEEVFDAIKNFNLEISQEIKSADYLGEQAPRKDDIFTGVKFDFEMNTSRQEVFSFLKKVNDRAKRITPDLQINITGVFSFPNGQTSIATIPDAYFAPFPVSSASRTEYVSVKVSGEASDWELQTS